MKRRRGYPARPSSSQTPTLSSPRRDLITWPVSKGQQQTYLHHGAGKIFSLFVCSIIKTGWAGARNKATHINDMGGGTRNWDGFGGALALVPCFSLFVFPFFLVCTDGEGLQ